MADVLQWRAWHSDDRAALVARFSDAGFVAPEDEADDLMAHAAGDRAFWMRIVARRLTGEPLAWITGHVQFCERRRPGRSRRVRPPPAESRRWPGGPRRSCRRTGTAIDLCTGAGAIAKVLSAAHPGRVVVASDLDPRAVACARSNGVEAFEGDSSRRCRRCSQGAVDVIVAVVPYVPTPALACCSAMPWRSSPRCPTTAAPTAPTCSGASCVRASASCGAGGWSSSSSAANRPSSCADDLARLGYDVATLVDEEGDVRGMEARRVRRADHGGQTP